MLPVQSAVGERMGGGKEGKGRESGSFMHTLARIPLHHSLQKSKDSEVRQQVPVVSRSKSSEDEACLSSE